MKMTVLAAGRVKEKWLLQGIAEYQKRLSKYCEINIIEIQDMPDTLPLDTVLEQEGKRLLEKIRDRSFVILLDLTGKKYDSLAFSRMMEKSFEEGGAEILFVIGGSCGVSQELRNRANLRVSLSEMTFTHQMTRLLLLEQCFRGFRILRGEPYHK